VSASQHRRRARVGPWAPATSACGRRQRLRAAPAESTCAYRRLRADVGSVRWTRDDGVEVSTASWRSGLRRVGQQRLAFFFFFRWTKTQIVVSLMVRHTTQTLFRHWISRDVWFRSSGSDTLCLFILVEICGRAAGDASIRHEQLNSLFWMMNTA
jgi:hypothetical protein